MLFSFFFFSFSSSGGLSCQLVFQVFISLALCIAPITRGEGGWGGIMILTELLFSVCKM